MSRSRSERNLPFQGNQFQYPNDRLKGGIDCLARALLLGWAFESKVDRYWILRLTIEAHNVSSFRICQEDLNIDVQLQRRVDKGQVP
jgi:hypothetical protein